MASTTTTTPAPLRPCGPPPPEAFYPSVEAAFTAIQAHAKANGYALTKRGARTANRIRIECDRAGSYRATGKDPFTEPSKQRKVTGSKKCSCQMRGVLALDSISNTWSFKVLYKDHNHPSSGAPSAHPAHRIASLSPRYLELIQALLKAGLSSMQVVQAFRREAPEVEITPKDVANIRQKARIIELGGLSPIQWLLQVNILLPYLYSNTYSNIGAPRQEF
jgi:hypothetical protein